MSCCQIRAGAYEVVGHIEGEQRGANNVWKRV